MNCPKCHKPLTPIGKTGRHRCTNPECEVVMVEVEHHRDGDHVTIMGGQSNSVSEGVKA
jgi:hypothetical protein